MEKKVITQLGLAKMKAGIKRRHVPVGKGLYLIIQPSGHKAWAFWYRLNGKQEKLTLGPFLDKEAELTEGGKRPEPKLGEALMLSGARLLAAQASLDVEQGIDPKGRKRAAEAAPKRGSDSFAAMVEKFNERHLKHMREGKEYLRLLNTLVLPEWSDKQITDIRKKDVIELLDKLRDRGMTGGASKCFAVIRKLFNWCVSRDILPASPCAGVAPPAAIVYRERVLTDDELRWFWKACDAAGYPFGPMGKLLLLTGQRLREVAEITADEINGVWTIPAARAKNKRPHDVPLSDAARAVLADIPRIHSKDRYFFTTTGESPISGFSRFKANLDKAMLKIARAETANDALEIPAWWLHDLRRTAASGMARLGINLPVIEKVLNHTSGSFAGIVGVYQRHNFADEKRAALEAWGWFITALVEDRAPSNVVEMQRRA